MAQKRKLTTLSLAEKVNLLKIIEKGEKKKQDIAKDFGIPASTLSTIIKNKDVILKNFNKNSATRKKMKLGEYSDIESCLLKWFQQCLDKKIPINGPILREKAEEFGHKLGHEHFKASSGWLTNWKIRNSVVFKQVCGESGAVDVQKCSVWINNLPKLIENYSPDDIFNVDETGLFFKCLPDKTFIFKGQSCSGGKHSKERVTLLLGANMSGTEKLRPLLIGKSKKPRCFRTSTENIPDEPSDDNNDEWDQLNINETFTSYVNVDENLEICGEWTENDIISDILDEDNEEEIEDQQIQSTITNKDAKLALETLRKYIEGNEGMEDLFKPLGESSLF
ncbi:tigger transposable element-derived protein 4-like [Rhopalosiphum padi]|uniref:tigger transposable element-derived protein 4-like n=1 Tax=Rhopalosiphum padi TaxID=40932 RepID=UPI00298E58A4|nr:tigger transposable element-derived protein 4-like [Rhopalosiphum padi]